MPRWRRAMAGRIRACPRRRPPGSGPWRPRRSDRRRARSFRHAAFRAQPSLLLEFLAHALALHLGEIVDEQPAVEVIDLVLHADREQPVEVLLEGLAVAILRAHADAGGA